MQTVWNICRDTFPHTFHLIFFSAFDCHGMGNSNTIFILLQEVSKGYCYRAELGNAIKLSIL